MLTNSMNMELPYYQKYNNDDNNNNNDENVHVLHGVLHGDSTMLVYVQQHHESKVLKILAQAMVLALLIMVLPEVVGANYRANNNNNNNDNNNNNNYVELITRGSEELLLNNNPNSISLILNDLANEGLVTSKDETLIVSHSQKQPIGYVGSLIVLPSDSERQRSVSDDTFDFAFSDCYAMVRVFIDRTLKLGGVVMVRLGWDPNSAFQVPSNYKIVYFRRIGESTYIAMRKTANAETTTAPAPASASAPAPPATAPVTTYYSSVRRRLLEFLSEEKKAVLGNLEDVLLEPPRSTTGRSKTYLRKTKFLPDLLNDSLDGYSRRVYIDVGGRGQGSTRWFKQNYPTRNKDFDMYRIETVPEAEVESDDAWEGPPTQMGISDWLWRNVKAEEYVVMKADAEVVEEMLKSKAIVLVDELFLECKPFGKGGSSKRAYWECLALYGRLRDFGVAVHQWWG